MCRTQRVSRFPTFSPHTSDAKDRGCWTCIMFNARILLNGFVRHRSDVTEELPVNEILLGSKIMRLKNILPIFIFVCSLFTVIMVTDLCENYYICKNSICREECAKLLK